MMHDLINTLKALADPIRIRILAVLRDQELCVCELFDALGLTQSLLSSHLRVLRQAGIVSTRKSGKWIYYRLAPEHNAFINLFLEEFNPPLKEDPQIKVDSRKLKERLKLRRKGCCVVGFVQPENAKKRGEAKCTASSCH
jgi:ArsR family transcriptional regulator, arsenate/arsenite/antimonite-responsive transcriptional repressor